VTTRSFFVRAAIVAAIGLPLSAQARAQSLADYDYTNLRFRGIGFDVGQIWPNKVQSTESYAIRLDLGFLGPNVRVTPAISYWSSSFKPGQLDVLATQLNQLKALQTKGVTVTSADLGKIDWSDFSVTMDAQYMFTLPANVYTYAGLGGGLHALNGKGTLIQNTLWEDFLDTVTIGFAAMAGVEVPVMQNFRVYGEARYTLLSDVRYPGVRVGGSYMLPTRPTVGVTGGK
jgi:opacity protein-like surface antigen